MYKALQVESISKEKNANNEMYIKRHKVRIKRIVLDLHDVIADSRKIVVFEYEMPLLSQ